MKLAVFGDIHANLEALLAVLEDARTEGCTEFACTGDLVGYNANPNECVEIVRDLNCPVVLGNHDEDSRGDHPLVGLNPKAHLSLTWTRQVLERENREWLLEIPYKVQTHGVSLVHATLDDPESWGYILHTGHAWRSFQYQTDTLCFHGHTHLHVIYSEQDFRLKVSYDYIELQPETRYLFNVGSVGKPRDKDQ